MMWSISSSIVTIFLFSATPLPDFSSIVYQPERSRPLIREIQPSAPAGGNGGGTGVWEIAARGERSEPKDSVPLTLTKSLRFIYRPVQAWVEFKMIVLRFLGGLSILG